jgi:hypothetical protein
MRQLSTQNDTVTSTIDNPSTTNSKSIESDSTSLILPQSPIQPLTPLTQLLASLTTCKLDPEEMIDVLVSFYIIY